MAALEAAEIFEAAEATEAGAAATEAGAAATEAEAAELGQGTEGVSKWANGKEFVFKAGKWILAGSLFEQFLSGSTPVGKIMRGGIMVVGAIVLLTLLIKIRSVVRPTSKKKLK